MQGGSVMATDYVLFLHGVNTHSEDYADPLIKMICDKAKSSDHSLVLIPVFWGNIQAKQDREAKLRAAYVNASIWQQVWFKNLRTRDMLDFASDAALYLSRYIGGAVAECIWNKWQEVFPSDLKRGDRLHIVTHSLGSVILFDLLFSSRWDAPSTLPGHGCVMALRKAIYGISRDATMRHQGHFPNEASDPQLNPDLFTGIELRSITTMGSPIGIFSLIDVGQNITEVPDATHDITPRLQIMLRYLANRMREESADWKLPWRNFLHPGDPVGSPLEILLPQLVDGQAGYLDVEDVLAPSNLRELLSARLPINIFDFFAKLVGWSTISVLNSANAHTSYWTSNKVAQGIADIIIQARS
jgi:hypothetical protein